MHNMEGDVIKKKTSSGCLIIRKKGNGVGGVRGSGLGSKQAFESRKEKKRPRLIPSDSESSDESLEPVRRKVVDKYHDGSVSYKRGNVEDSRNSGFESDRYDRKRGRRDYMDDRFKLVGQSENHLESGIGPSRNLVVDRRKDICYERKSKGLNNTGKRRYDMEDESRLHISLLREKYGESPDGTIRLQGKNGVLKVMVNKKKKQGFPDKSYNHHKAENRKGSRSEAAVKMNEAIPPSFYSESKRPEKPVSFAKKEESDLKLRKSLPVMSSKVEDSETDDSNTSLKKESTIEQPFGPTKAIINEDKRTPPNEIMTPLTGSNEGKVKRGSGTEKQLLREKIKSMLLDRGWTIDYRPRRNRVYLDAVYINPAGTAYWSIIKAYEALQKQLEDEDDNVKPLADEILSKLTRQTRKKIEREMKKKKRDASCRKSVKKITLKESVRPTTSEQREEKPPKHDRSERPAATKSRMVQGRTSGKIGRCTLLVRSSDKFLNSEADDGFVPYNGKRTLLSWLIDSGIVHMREKVQYMNRKKTKAMLEGWITKDGIHCSCCSKILTISKFEIHAGSKQGQPFPNILVGSGLSLMQCQIDAWNRQEESDRKGFHHIDVDGDDQNDDACGICGDGGDLICCDGCPSTFHQCCLDLQMLPADDWHCPNCTCKFCGFADWGSAEANDRIGSSLLLCRLCEQKYHQSCCEELDDLSVDSVDATNLFCGKTCREIFVNLQKLLGVKHELESGFSWSLVHRTDPAASEASHLGFSQRVECNSKLAIALSVMDECFLPIVDRRSGTNLIRNVLYNRGSNFSRLNHNGFYTAILERGDEIISAASLRIHGTQLAEMPFIGTRIMYRRQGMCRRLLCAIESALSSLKVEKLIIPSIVHHTWTKTSNFSPLNESLKQETRSMNILVFPGTNMLQKQLVNRDIKEGSITAKSGMKSSEVKESRLMLPVLRSNSALDSSSEHDDTELNPPVEDHTQISACDVTDDDSLKENVRASCMAEEAVEEIQKSVSVSVSRIHNSTESTHIDSDE